jgi:hypothetical protein
MGVKTIQNFMLISDPKKLFRKNAPKKVKPKHFFSGDFFNENFLELSFF